MKTHHVGIISGIMVLASMVVFSLYMFHTNEKTAYDFDHPEKTYVLSDSLKEVSGLTFFNKNMLACVEDEHGLVYVFDLEEGHIKRKILLQEFGDFEGIARVGKRIYLLRSDGTLFVRSTKLKDKKVEQFDLQLPSENYECLFFDQQKNRLLVVSRETNQDENGVPVYAFNLQTKQLEQAPVLKLRLNKAERDRYIFAPSELAFHPVTGELYVLSAADHALFVFDEKGNAKWTQALNPTVFNKPEGMVFAKNGDLYISNEGQTEKPTIQKFLWVE